MVKYKRPSHTPNYTLGIVIAHGDSEKIIARHIKSSLRLNLHIHRKSTSIQVDGLFHELNTNYKNVNQLQQNEQLELRIDKGAILDFKIFTLMDTDDCSESIKAKYIDKSLFDRYKLKEYVIPIYTNPDLEHVLYQCKLIPKIFNDSEKVREYGKIFPISREPYGVSKIDDMRQLSAILKNNQNTNMEKFIDYCIEMAEMRKANP